MIRRIAGSNSVFAALVGAEGLEPEMGLKRRRRLCGENSVHVVPVKPAAPSSAAPTGSRAWTVKALCLALGKRQGCPKLRKVRSNSYGCIQGWGMVRSGA